MKRTFVKIRNSSVSIVTRLRVVRQGVPFPAWEGVLLFTASRPTLGPTQPPIQSVRGALSPGIKRPGREANNLLPSDSEVNMWSYTSTSQYVFMAWCLIKHRDNFMSVVCELSAVNRYSRVGVYFGGVINAVTTYRHFECIYTHRTELLRGQWPRWLKNSFICPRSLNGDTNWWAS
jgi:hypothetical protein